MVPSSEVPTSPFHDHNFVVLKGANSDAQSLDTQQLTPTFILQENLRLVVRKDSWLKSMV